VLHSQGSKTKRLHSCGKRRFLFGRRTICARCVERVQHIMTDMLTGLPQLVGMCKTGVPSDPQIRNANQERMVDLDDG